MVHVVLASASPRRRELLRRIGVDAEVRVTGIDEEPRRGEAPSATVARLAAAKAAAVDVPAGALVIAADTEVVLDGAVLGKPAGRDEAGAMLATLSGREHAVLTGVHVRCDGRESSAVEETTVRFRELDVEEIDAYVATGEPLDKAGSYGIQGAGGMFVERIEGSDTNVVGLPLATVVRLAADVGVRLLPSRLDP